MKAKEHLKWLNKEVQKEDHFIQSWLDLIHLFAPDEYPDAEREMV
jgi:hypothetical protein